MEAVNAMTLSRASLALLIVGLLVAGVLVGAALPTLLGVGATPIPAPTVLPASPRSAALPEADVAGEDLERLPRYPGSVRSEYEASSNDRFRMTSLEFLADATLDEVRAFYQGVILEHGWQRADIAFSGGEWTYILVDGRTEALIEMEQTGGLTEIDLQVSEPIPAVTEPPSQPTPARTPAPPAPPPGGGDDDDDGDGDDTDDDDGTDD